MPWKPPRTPKHCDSKMVDKHLSEYVKTSYFNVFSVHSSFILVWTRG